jgi:hypothetical protein
VALGLGGIGGYAPVEGQGLLKGVSKVDFTAISTIQQAFEGGMIS